MSTVTEPTAEVLVPRGCTNLRLRQLVRRLDQHYDAELAKAGLKTTQYSLLSHVVKFEPVGPGALARAMKMQPSTLTRNLRPLVAAGWVAQAAGADARSRSITSTAAGREKRGEAQRRWKTAQLRLNQLLEPGRVVALHALVDQCMDLLSDVQSGQGAGVRHA
jgi:DNA-binding MarR family transcriptional regulator